ncbi:putative glucose-methanol-choline oxidoreductase, long-chain-alcohol oxidase [Lupinus albus]|uniref:Putative glucose-methanol-choline oxidoreductase, long-chain-alcohol oxidase n=1 Tax=Lupinus albus TaxID=3870 RepID=A0A6A4NB28_LUPAL|nr:putative glucose-methanol-choline oxidoreductase, long-chain-alcohol oxidase [Lupinus albus]
MASVGALKFLLWLVLWHWNFLPLSQGKEKYRYEDEYPFIRNSSTFQSPPSISTTSTNNAYDYIIVGGGTSGCPLAATLSQNFSVLLLERGGVPFTNSNVTFLRNFHISLADTSPTSASQYFCSTDGVHNARARILGGGSSINAGFYTRASTRFMEKVGWDTKLVNQSYTWVEKRIVHRPKLSPYQAAVRDSLLDSGVSPFNGFTYDHIYGTKVGGTIFDRFGRRHTAAELLASGNPDKLTVLVYATVQKIVFDDKGKIPKAIGVIFKDENGRQHEAILRNDKHSEVIVSSGAIGTPQLLLLSGIGSKEELQKLNITLILDNPNVGKGMVDNPMNTIFVPSNRPVTQSLIQTVGITKLGVYIEASSGFSQSNDSIHCNHGMLSAEIGQISTIPPKQRSKEAIQAFVENKRDIPIEAFKGGFILSKVASAWSAGKLRLNNTNVEDNPIVTFNYFSHRYDLQRCVEGIRLATKVVQSQHFTNYTLCDKKTTEKLLSLSVNANVNLIPKHPNDTKSLEQFCRDTVITIWHYHGGCHVGKVVSNDYKVLGVDRIRVVDGSTFPESPGTNPQATVMMMGRYMGLKILRERLGKLAGI